MSNGEHPSPGDEQQTTPKAERSEQLRHTSLALEVLEPGDPRAALARQLEAEVLEEFFGNTPEELAEEYGDYEAASVFLLMYDREAQKPAGMLRLIRNSPKGLKTVNDIESDAPGYPWHQSVDEVLERNHLAFDRDRVLDIGTVAIAPDYRGRRDSSDVSYGLYRGLYTYSRSVDCQAWVGILDDNFLKYTQEQMGGPFRTFEGLGSGSYIGSEASTPIYSIIADLPGQASNAVDQGFYRKCILGEDMPGVEFPEELDRIRS